MGRLFEFDRSVLLQVQAVVHNIQRGIGWTSTQLAWGCLALMSLSGFLSFDSPLWLVVVLIEGSLLLYQPPKKAQDTLDWNFIDSLTRLFLLSLVIPAIFTGSGFYNSCFVMFYYVRHTQELPPAPSQLKQWLEKTVDSLAPQPASVRVS